MIRFLLFSLFSLTLFHTNAQNTTIIGSVTDADGHPLSGVRYYLTTQPNKSLKSDKEGRYSFTGNLNVSDTIRFENFAFGDFDLVVTKKMLKTAEKKQLIIDVVMPDKQTQIVVVRPNVPDTLYGTQAYSIADFEFHESGNLVLLTYDKNLSKGSVLRVLNKEKKITDRYYVDGEAVELRKDFKGNIHLLTEEAVYLVLLEDSKLYVYPENRDYFFKYVAPVIDTIGANIYYSNYSDIYPAFDYFEFNRDDSTYKVMLKVEDEPMMELYRAEFKYVDVRTKLWAHNKQLETGIDKEIWVGATVFTNSLYYEPLYAPLFASGEDSIYVFDHYKNYLFKYHPEGGFADSVRISYHLDARKSGWEQPLIQDRGNDKVYAIFLRNGYTYLSEIDPYGGGVKKSFRLHFKYVERIRIINDEVYYIYRPFESVQKKYIYREELKE